MHSIAVGDRVWYWARRLGERPHIKTGTVQAVEGEWTRVRLDEPQVIPVQSVALSRLKLGVPTVQGVTGKKA